MKRFYFRHAETIESQKTLGIGIGRFVLSSKGYSRAICVGINFIWYYIVIGFIYKR